MAQSQWITIIKNISDIEQTIEDLGITLDSTAELNFDEIFSYDDLAESKDLKDLLLSESLVLNDGTDDLSATDAIEYLNIVQLNYLKENYYDKEYLNSQLLNKNTLDEAYNEGGSGAGRIIDATSGAVKIDVVDANNAPLELTEKSSLPTVGLAAGQLATKDGLLFIYDGTRSKWLSTSRMFLVFGRSGRTTSQYLNFYSGNIPSNNSGLRLARDAVIVSMAGQFNQSGTGIFHVGKNDIFSSIGNLSINSALGGHNTSLNINLNAGDYLQSYIQTSIDVWYPMLIIEIAWRS
jgi:hypothetical protein